MKTIREADRRWLCLLFGEPYEAEYVPVCFIVDDEMIRATKAQKVGIATIYSLVKRSTYTIYSDFLKKSTFLPLESCGVEWGYSVDKTHYTVHSMRIWQRRTATKGDKDDMQDI